jgi:glycosyltransferase involved in cell wall biosynthesis
LALKDVAINAVSVNSNYLTGFTIRDKGLAVALAKSCPADARQVQMHNKSSYAGLGWVNTCYCTWQEEPLGCYRESRNSRQRKSQAKSVLACGSTGVDTSERWNALDEAVVSAVIRAKDKASTIRDAIASVKCQRIPVEIIVVDSGSRDATPQIAREMGARVISIPAETFSYGGAINTGVSASNTEYILILSAHCSLPGPRWLEVALRHFDDSRVVGVNGTASHRARLNRTLSAEQRLIIGATHDIVVQDGPISGVRGFSNSCSLVRRSACRQFPFNEEMIFAEDKEWANRVTQAGHRIVFDAELGVFSAHRRKEGYRSLYLRAQKEGAALSEMHGDRAWTLRKAVQHAALIFTGRFGVMRLAPFHPANLIEYAGRISGSRQAARRDHG